MVFFEFVFSLNSLFYLQEAQVLHISEQHLRQWQGGRKEWRAVDAVPMSPRDKDQLSKGSGCEGELMGQFPPGSL